MTSGFLFHLPQQLPLLFVCSTLFRPFPVFGKPMNQVIGEFSMALELIEVLWHELWPKGQIEPLQVS